MKKLHIAALVLALAFGLCACGGEGAQTPSEAPVETATPTVPATPTASPEATATPTPSPTPSPTVEPSPEATPEVTATPTPKPTPEVKPEQPQETNVPNVPQLNLSENAEKNVKIPEQVEYPDSPIPGLSVGTGGPMAGSSATGVSNAGEIEFTDEELWDPASQVSTYLGNEGKTDLNDFNWDSDTWDEAGRASAVDAGVKTREEAEEYLANGGKVYGDP